MANELAQRAAELDWYHTFDLAAGVTTRGMFDHRRFVTRLPWPASMRGLRCLDAAASDGFFGFEMARRGAAEVVSVDLPDHAKQDYAGVPRERESTVGRANQCFDLVRETTGLSVDRVDGSVYELGSLGLGQFDFVFLGNILLHLRDPIRALHEVRGVTRGELLSVEPVSFPLTVLRPFTPAGQYSIQDENTFWTPNMTGHRRIIASGGFAVVAAAKVPILQPMGDLTPARPAWSSRPRNLHELVYWGFTRPFGKMTSWVRAVPRR